jgi:hypothetical protein
MSTPAIPAGSNGISTDRNLTGKAACLKQSGINFVFRYYSRTTQLPEKRLTLVEATALSNAGLQIGVVYEDKPTSAAYFSSERGRLDAAGALQAAAALNQPQDSALYFAVDYDARPSEISGPIVQYFNGVAEAMSDAGSGYGIGVYGSGSVCRILGANCPFLSFTWLAEAQGWQGTRTYAGWDVKQVIATSTLCGLAAADYEANVAPGEFGGFSLVQAMRA